MITGYNTDVEYGGVTYHVQTEDKGLQTPVILSLVYSGGAILAAKRSPYNDLVARGFDQDVLATRLQRQHKLICAAVHAGRIEDLKRMTERESAPTAGHVTAPAPNPTAPKSDSVHAQASSVVGAEPIIDDQGLAIKWIGEPVLRGGQSATLRFRITRAGREVPSGVAVVVKLLGSTFSPQTARASTVEGGIAGLTLALPDFKSGRAAILVQAEDSGETAELRRIILPSNS